MISEVVKTDLDDILEDINKYILNTYGEHYAQGTVQTIDAWEAKGTLTDTAIDQVIKYIWRLGRKEGFNKKDLLKAIHFLIIVYAKEFPQEVVAKPMKPIDPADVIPYGDTRGQVGGIAPASRDR